MLNNNTLLWIIIIININSFLIGYLFGHYTSRSGVSNNTSFFTQQKQADKKSVVSIDDAKFVVDIKTEGLEKKYDSLGDKKTTEDNISESVNKLKNLRGKS
jgi:flagellar basal body-associated protein FliL